MIWQNPLHHPVLDRERVHIWRANLDISPDEVTHLSTLLSLDETARANKYRFPEHKRRFIVARGILRQLLGNYLDISPNDLKFEYGDRGKPHVLGSNTCKALQFNISHSEEYALFGFTSDRLIGVDIEYLREMPDAVKIAKRFFSPKEYDLIRNLNAKQQCQAFFKLWTAKEAYFKAIGTGLSGYLASIDINFDSSGDRIRLSSSDNSTSVDNWSIYPCVPASNYVGTIAIDTRVVKQQIHFWSWN